MDNDRSNAHDRQTDGGPKRFGDFAPAFARINDDVLFGEVRSRTEALGLRQLDRVTVVSLVSQGLVDASLEYHFNAASAIASILCITTGFGS